MSQLMQSIKKWIEEPDFKSHDDNQSAFYLQVIALIMILGAAAIGVSSALAKQWNYVILIVTDILVNCTILLMVRRKLLKPAISLFLIFTLAFLTYSILSVGGIHALTSVLYPIVIIFASLFLERKSFIAYCALCVSSVGVVVFSEYYQLSPVYVPDPPHFPLFFAFSLMILGSAILIRFITESLQDNLRKTRQHEHELTTQKEILERVGQAVVACLPDNTIFYWNKAASSYYGWPAEEALGKKYNQLMPVSASPETLEAISSDLRTGNVWSGELLIQKRDGSFLPTLSTLAPLHDKDGKMSGWVGIAADLSERKQVEETLRESEDRFKSVFDYSIIGKSITRLSGQVEVNRAFCEMMGYSPEELQNRKWQEFTHPDDIELTQREIASLLSGEKSEARFAKRFIHKNGSVVWVDLSSALRRDKAGKPLYLMTSLVDITERKQIEDALQESRNILQVVLDTIPVRAFWKDRDLKYLGCNRPFALDAGVHSPEEMIGKDDYQMGWRDQADLYRSDDRQILESGKPKLNYEEPQTTPDGRCIWLRTNKVPLQDTNGTIWGILGTYEDITERKQAEEALRQANLIVESSPVMLFRWKAAEGWPVMLVSQNVTQLGYTAEELINGSTNFASIVHPDDVEWVGREVQSNSASGVNRFQQEYRIVTKDGAVRWIDDRTFVERNTEGQVTHYQGIVVDITERKRAEAFRVQAESELRTGAMRQRLFDFSRELLSTVDIGEILENVRRTTADLAPHDFFSPYWIDDVGRVFRPIETKGRKWFSEPLFQTWAIPFGQGIMGDVARKQQAECVNNSHLDPRSTYPPGFREQLSIEHSIFLPIRSNEKMIGMLVLGRRTLPAFTPDEFKTAQLLTSLAELALSNAHLFADLEKRVAERTAQLAASEERYRLISTVSSDYMFSSRLNHQGQLVLDWVAGAFESITGYTFDEYVARGGWATTLHPDDVEQDARDMAALQANQTVVTEVRTIAKNSEIRWVRIYAHPVWNAQRQQLVGIYGAVQDITKHKQAETALRESEEKYRRLVEISPVAMWINQDGIITYMNPAALRILGATDLQQVVGRAALDFIHPDYHATVKERISQMMDREHIVPLRAEKYIRLDGSVVDVEVTATPFSAAGGRAMQVLFQDITERKRTEEALRESRQMLHNVLDQFPGVVFWKDRHSVYLGCNRAFSTGAGLASSMEIVGKTDLDLPWAATEATAYRADDSAVMSSGEPRLGIIEPQHQSDGRIAWFDTAKVPLTDEQGNVFGVLGTSRDITEQVHTLQALQETEFFLNRSQQVARIGSYKFDVATGHWISSPSVDDILGIDDTFPKTVDGWLKLVAPEDRGMLQDHLLQHVLAEYQRFDIEYRIIRPRDGQMCWVSGQGELEFDASGHPIRMIGTIQDINEHKQAEAREARHREMLEKVIQLGKAVTQITDLKRCLRKIHQSVQKGLGFDRVGLFLYDRETGAVKGTLGTGNNGEIADNSSYSGSIHFDKAWEDVIRNPGGFRHLNDYQTYYNAPTKPDMQGVKEHIVISTWAGDLPVGFISADNFLTQSPFEPEQIEALQLFAGYAGLAVQNARWNEELEKRVEKRTAELESANLELESLSHTIGHDLRSPIRAIVAYSYMLLEDLSGKLETSHENKLQQINQVSSRMGHMVDDFLTFLMLSRTVVQKQSVDVKMLVERVIEELKAETAGRTVEFSVLPMPDCLADPSLLKDVYLQLVSNALKFTISHSPARIEIGAFENQGQSCYFVRDNGVGFEMKYASKLFGIFQRLHHVSEFEGTGAGLAIVQRIIHRHGGRIWAESKVDQGATFYFTLPPV